MGNIKVVINSRVFIGIFVFAVGLLLIPLSLVPKIDKSYYAQTGTYQVTEGSCPPQIPVYLDIGSYSIRLRGPFIIGPSTCVVVRDGDNNIAYQSSIDAENLNEEGEFEVTNPEIYTISIENGGAHVELLKLSGQKAWFESVTYPGQPLIIIGIIMATVGAAVLLAARAGAVFSV